jgi:electron transport complex protein RnfB
MHTVIEAECTGCDLCIPPCPVECIDIVPVRETITNWIWPLPGDTLPDTTGIARSQLETH